MEPSRDKDCGGGDGEPENPRTVGEKEACYESLKRAAEKLMKGQVTSHTDMRLLEHKLSKSEGIIRDQADCIAKYSERNVKLTTMLEHQQKLLSSLEFEVKTTQTMCNCIKETVTTFGERVQSANEDVSVTAKQMKLQEEAVASLEAEARLVLQWKTEHLKKLTELDESAKQRKRAIGQLEAALEQSKRTLSQSDQDKGRLQGQIAAEAEAMTKLTSKATHYRNSLKQVQSVLSQHQETVASLRAALEESTVKGNGLSQALKEQAETAERERDALLGQQADLTSQIEVLRCQVDTLSQSNDARNAEIASLNEQLRASEEQLERQQERFDHLTVENNDLRASKGDLLAELQELKQWLDSSKEQTARLASERDEQALLILELQTESAEVRSLFEGEQAERKKAEEVAAEMRARLEHQQAATALVESDLGSLQAGSANMLHEIQLLRGELLDHEATKKRACDLESRLGAATSNLDALQKTVASAHEARARVEEELQAKTDEGRKLATLLDEARRNNEVLASAVRQEERKLEEIGDRLNMEQNRADEAFAQLSAERDAKERELKKQLQKLQETLHEKVP